MPLLNKDGKPYRTLTEPNPILTGQENLGEIVLHNLHWQPVTVAAPKKTPAPPPPEKEASKEVSDFLDLLKKEAETLKKEVPPQPAKPVTPNVFDDDETILVHCHPAVIREYTDNFYQETRQTIQFGEKKILEALLVDQNDIEITLFTNENVTLGSVLYPSRYKNGQKLELFRWWKVVRNQQAKDGFLVLGEVTEQQARFTD